MHLRTPLVAAMTLAASIVIAVNAPSATAAPAMTRHNGVVVTTPRHAAAWNGRTAAVKPRIWVRPGMRRQVLDHLTMAFRNGRRIARGRTLHLHAGTYRIAVRIKYRGWHLVTKTREVKVRHYPDDGSPNNTSCTVTSLDNVGFPAWATCTSPSYPGQSLHVSGTGPHFCPDLPADNTYYVGQVLTDNICADFKPYYTTKTVHYQARKYSRVYRFTTPRHVLVVTARHRSAPVQHQCTTTSSGSCIQGGEFCPQADYGMTGYDANGDTYVCTGDSTHPHWE